MGLTYKYCEVWDLVLGLLETFYGIATKPCSKFLAKSLQSLSELHHTPNFPFVAELEGAFGAAVTSLGPRFVLSEVPLKLEETKNQPDFPQSWILPVLKSSIRKSELTFFTSEFLPLAGQMRVLSQQWMEKGKTLEGKLYQTLEHQIWSLLPSFCKECTDIDSSFPGIAKLLGSTLKDRPDICPLVCQSLYSLIEESQKHECNRSTMSMFSKNFLPILFNLYSTINAVTDDSTRALILQCIKAYLSITKENLLSSLFSKLLSKLQDPTEATLSISRTALEDITEVFVPFISASQISDLFEMTCESIDSANPTQQKKAYKLLSSILSCNTSEHSLFITENLVRIQEILLGSLSTAGAGSKKPRLRCLLQIASRIDSESSGFIVSVVPEAILCTKESNEKCRNLAYQLLKSLGYASQRCYLTTPEESIQKYFTVVLAGLAGSTHMVSATIGTMARLVYEFNDILGGDLISNLLSQVCVFFSAKSKEVVRSTLIFIKVVIGVLPTSELSPHVEELVTKILKWNENHQSHFRMKSRYILEKLTQKFSYEMVDEFVPAKHKRLLIHIRKTLERKKKQQLKKDQLDHTTPKDDDEDFVKVKRRTAKPSEFASFEELLKDSDDESDEVSLQGRKGRRGSERGGTWLEEGDSDEPLDFMDQSVTKRIMSTKPLLKQRRTAREADWFKVAPNGKLLIHDGNDDMNDGVSENSANEDGDEMESSSDQRKGTGRKRKLSMTMEESNRNGINSGAGIYRKDPKKEPGVEYRAKKAKGDVKKPGKPDPYAYIQLNRQKLNKRKKAKLSGEFTNILNKAKKGAAKGHKQKRQ